MSNVNKIEAIREMCNADEEFKVRLADGEFIKAWSLVDEQGAKIDIQELDNNQVLEVYEKTLSLEEPAK
jgi:hypothetical protein